MNEPRAETATPESTTPEPTSATLEKMRAVLASRFGIDDPMLDLDRPLESLGLDSLAFVEYAFDLEKALHIVLPDLPRDLVTIGDLARYVDSEVRRQTQGGGIK